MYCKSAKKQCHPLGTFPSVDLTSAPVSVNLAWQMSHAKQPFKGMIKHLLPIKGLMNLNFTDMITHKYSEAREKALSLT